MTLSTLVLIILILLFLGALPKWPHAQNWGYAPFSSIGVILVIVLVLLLLGRI